ncbi:Myc-type, basic helix-loop-helix (bHLH) domain-containing protein [Artemisia annua]|uniref:Myc-type, basic helix-loop-helix (BHLH) domain-containing protein n=1 Tax=Artemisia annua TaxID=35608 RepID=A0A2U1NB14_ARTAN|nr:Myc-type, basic helix-loop-helix (bHLH) domain-containing protein [Artemisia annua]
MEDGGFMTQYDNMCKPYDMVDKLSVDSISSENILEKESSIDRFFQTPSRFEEPTEINLLSYQKASNINRRSSTPNTIAATTHSSFNTFTISFRDTKAKEEIHPSDDSLGYESAGTGKAPIIARTPLQAQDHVLAERKRREKLNRQFISMSALLPNLKKMDKASVLEDATNYIRELQDRVKELEALSDLMRKDTKDILVALKRYRLSRDEEDDSSLNETNSGDHSAGVPSESSAEIEVRISGGSVLVRIYSHKTYSLAVKVLSQMQSLGINIISSSTMPFANTITVITIVAQMDKASVLEDATNYIRELQDRVKELEALSDLMRKDTKDILVALKRYRLSRDEEDDSSLNETNSGDHSAGVPSESSAEIEVRISGGSVLVRIYSHKTYSLAVKVLSQMQSLGINIISSSTMPFANTITVITIVAQIEEDFVMTAADLVSKLQLA